MGKIHQRKDAQVGEVLRRSANFQPRVPPVTFHLGTVTKLPARKAYLKVPGVIFATVSF